MLPMSLRLFLLTFFFIILCCARDQGSAGRKRLSLGIDRRLSDLFTEMKSDTQGDSGYIELP